MPQTNPSIEDVAAAIEQLTNHQQQLDMDGAFVGVSRQALDELLAAYQSSLNQIACPSGGEGDEAYEIGKEDGYSEAVQQIDQLTGGDGEYRYCLGMEYSERHCPDPETMIRRIVERFGRPPDPAVGATARELLARQYDDESRPIAAAFVRAGNDHGDDDKRAIRASTAALARAGGSEVALEGYRAAISYVGADSWDGCNDCIEILKAASAADADKPRLSPGETAAALARLRALSDQEGG